MCGMTHHILNQAVIYPGVEEAHEIVIVNLAFIVIVSSGVMHLSFGYRMHFFSDEH